MVSRWQRKRGRVSEKELFGVALKNRGILNPSFQNNLLFSVLAQIQ